MLFKQRLNHDKSLSSEKIILESLKNIGKHDLEGGVEIPTSDLFRFLVKDSLLYKTTSQIQHDKDSYSLRE